jgi:glycosyltransferase involved in cell wall biosynthesis
MISVIIPCYGPVYAKFLGECVESVQAQTFKDWEIVIATGDLDDPGTHVARELERASARKWGIEARPVRLLMRVAQSITGKPHARNKGILAARGEWILPLDADDVLDPTCLEKMWARLPRTPMGMVSSDLAEFGLRSNYWTLPIDPPRTRMEVLRRGYSIDSHIRQLLPNENPLSHTTLFSKTAWVLSGGYDEGDFALEDWDLWLSIYKRCSPVLEIIHEPLLKHRIHGNNDYACVGGSTAEEYSRNALSKALLKLRHSYLYDDDDRTLTSTTILREMTPAFEEKVRLRARQLPDCESLKSLLSLLDSNRS